MQRAGELKWVTLTERSGYSLLTVDNRKVLVLVPISETGVAYLRVVGYYINWRLMGEQYDRLSFMVEEIAADKRDKLQDKIRAALSPDQKNLRITY